MAGGRRGPKRSTRSTAPPHGMSGSEVEANFSQSKRRQRAHGGKESRTEELKIQVEEVDSVDDAQDADDNEDTEVSYSIEQEDEEEDEDEVFRKYEWHFDMLNDQERITKFKTAVRANITALQNGLQRPPKVLDIGAGSGLLSLIAAEAGAQEVIAVEADPTLADIAAQIVTGSKFKDKIKLHNTQSTDLRLPASSRNHKRKRRKSSGEGSQGEETPRSDLLVSEVLDSGLLGEQWLRTLRDALDRLLYRPSTVPYPSLSLRVIPYSARVYGQLVSCPDSIYMQHLSVEALSLELPAKYQTEACPGLSSPVYMHCLRMIEEGKMDLVSQPFKALDFDFTEPPGPSGRYARLTVPLTKKHQTVHGVLFWWEVELSPLCPAMSLSTAIDKNGTRDHWRQALSIFHRPIVCGKAEQPISSVEVLVAHNDAEIWFNGIPSAVDDYGGEQKGKWRRGEAETDASDSYRLCDGAPPTPDCECGLHSVLSMRRLWQLNDGVRNRRLKTALGEALALTPPSSLCVDVSDGSLLALYASDLGASKIFTVENSDGGRAVWKKIIRANPTLLSTITVLKSSEQLKKGDKIGLLLSEPYYEATESGWSLEPALNFWHQRTTLANQLHKNVRDLPPCKESDFRPAAMLATQAHRMPHLPTTSFLLAVYASSIHIDSLIYPFSFSQVVVFPARARLMAALLEADGLWNTRKPLASVEGFDHTAFNVLQSLHTHTYSLPLWMYSHRLLSDPQVVGDLDFSSPMEAGRQQCQLAAARSGRVHGAVLWLEYQYGPSATLCPLTGSKFTGRGFTEPSPDNQGIHFLDQPEDVKGGELYDVVFSLDIEMGEALIGIQRA